MNSIFHFRGRGRADGEKKKRFSLVGPTFFSSRVAEIIKKPTHISVLPLRSVTMGENCPVYIENLLPPDRFLSPNVPNIHNDLYPL